MIGYILALLLFIFGLFAKLLLLPLFLFKLKTMDNKVFHDKNNSIIYFVYVVFHFISTFIIGSVLIVNSYRITFIILWLLVMIMDVFVFTTFYNRKGNCLGGSVGFVVLLREIIYYCSSFVILSIYYSSDYDTYCYMYGGLIWGFSATRYIDSFPKYYIFGNVKPDNSKSHLEDDECKTTNIYPGTTDEPTTTMCPITNDCECRPKPNRQAIIFSLINSVNIIILSILTILIGFGFDEVYVTNIGISYLTFCGFYFFYKHYKQRINNH